MSFVASRAPFIESFTKDILFTLQPKRRSPEKHETIHTDLIPKFSQRVVSAALNSSLPHLPQLQKPILPPTPMNSPIPPSAPIEIEPGYGKILPLLHDPSIRSIECAGPGSAVMVSRFGQKQPTRIMLGKEEIRAILEQVAFEAHIPLIEGVFRAAVKDFSISAIISDIVGTKFIIKK